MEFKKSPQALIDVFDSLLPGPPAQRRQMFGYPAAFVNNHMFMGLFQDQMLVRLPEPLRGDLLKLAGAKPFEPMPGRLMKDYVVLPPALIADRAKLGEWVAKALEYASALPAKADALQVTRLFCSGTELPVSRFVVCRDDSSSRVSLCASRAIGLRASARARVFGLRYS